jgi:ribosomal protein S18 acetylase RimI-like enzyme
VLPGYRGHVDRVEPVLTGWVSKIARPAAPVSFAVTIDGRRCLAILADRPRPDVAAAGLAAEKCGFAAALPPVRRDGTEHDLALVLPDGRDLDLPGLIRRIALGPVHAEIVPAGGADLALVLDLLRRNDGEAGLDPSLVTRDNAAAFDAIRSPEQGFVFYARAHGRLVGYGRLDRGVGAAAGFAIVALTVLSAYRRKGLGERLMRALLAAAAGERSLVAVWLSVRPDNSPAICLYDKLGFVRDHDHPPGRWAAPGELTMVWRPQPSSSHGDIFEL